MVTYYTNCFYVQNLCFSYLEYTEYTQKNGAVSKVNKKFISHLTRAQRTPSAAATVQVSHALPAVRSLVLTAGLRGQFPRWRRSRKRLSVCSVSRCPDLWLQRSVQCSARCARVRWEINFLLTFETAPFICKHTVYLQLVSLSVTQNQWLPE